MFFGVPPIKSTILSNAVPSMRTARALHRGRQMRSLRGKRFTKKAGF